MDILEKALKNGREIQKHRHTIHRNPEIGFYLPETCDYVMKWALNTNFVREK